MTKFVHVRDLKNQTMTLLREVEKCTNPIANRRIKPLVPLRPSNESDLHPLSRYPTTVSKRHHIKDPHPEQRNRTAEEKRLDFEMTQKIADRLCLCQCVHDQSR